MFDDMARAIISLCVLIIFERKCFFRVIIAGKHKFMFLVRGPLILVAVCCANDSAAQVSHNS